MSPPNTAAPPAGDADEPPSPPRRLPPLLPSAVGGVVVIVQHDPDDGPCYFGDYLTRVHIPFVVIHAYLSTEKHRVPRSVDDVLVVCPVVVVSSSSSSSTDAWEYRLAPEQDVDENAQDDDGGSGDDHDALVRFSALIVGVASMGGWMSVNDNLPYYQDVFALYRSALEHEVPIVGHCLGGQLLSRCLGGVVTRNSCAELGWISQRALYHDATTRPHHIKNWFGSDGNAQRLPVYEWHSETFSIPSECTLIATGEYCTNQAFQYKDQFVIGMQFHVEVNEQKMEAWISKGHPALFRNESERCTVASEVQNPRATRISPAAWTIEELRRPADRAARLARAHVIADRVYDVWVSGLRRRHQIVER